MIVVPVGDCEVSILPYVSGMSSGADLVREAFGNYDAYGTSLGIEGVQAVQAKLHLEGEFEVSEIDLAYAQRMQELTGEQVAIPSPAVCELAELCARSGKTLLALDMDEADFTELYCDTVKAWDFVKEHRMAKKGLKRKFDSTTPEQFALDWDGYINGVKGYREVSRRREEYIAARIRDVASRNGSLLAVIEIERAQGIADLLR